MVLDEIDAINSSTDAAMDLVANIGAKGDLPKGFNIIAEQVISGISPIIQEISVFVGGIFGLYLLYFLIKLLLEKRRMKLLKEIHSDIEYVKQRTLSDSELKKLRIILSDSSKSSKKSLKKAESGKSKGAKKKKRKKRRK